MSNENFEHKENEIYLQYQNIIAPFVTELEVRDAEYPVEILNEIRSIFTHLSRYKIQKSEKDIDAAQNHSKRAILDCYKYLCISMEEKIKKFRKDYRFIDLGYVNNGEFLPKLNKLEIEAKNSFKKAKKSEIKNEIDEDEKYQLYENAYNKYSEIDKFLDDSQEAILYAGRRSKLMIIITVTSIVITIISIITSIL